MNSRRQSSHVADRSHLRRTIALQNGIAAESAAPIAPGKHRSDTNETPMPLRIALYQPDIPQNTGAILRLCACLGVEAHIIEPAGFPVSDRAFRRAGMDYLDQVSVIRHDSWNHFREWRQADAGRLILLTTHGRQSFVQHAFHDSDILLLGRESAGVPDAVHDEASARLTVPMRPGLRSINVAMTCAMVLGEALRQTNGFTFG
jgi:tRNA (cytidine/uridine-2'-O-)-methyltransferase